MTRFGYLALVALLLLAAGVGALVAAPRPHELDVAPTLACDAWFAHPTNEDTVRLDGCVVDAVVASYYERLDARGIDSALVHVRPAGWEPSVEGDPPAELLWHTRDPEVLALVDRGRHAEEDGEDARRRFEQRYERELTRARPIIGAISRHPSREARELEPLMGDTADPDPFVIESDAAPLDLRAGALAVLVLSLLGLIPLVLLQRRWTRRRDALLGRSTEPRRF